MKNWNEIDDNINELIMSRSFDQLTDEEKTKALEYAGSEQEYNNLRNTLLAITSSFSDEMDDFAPEQDDMKDDLMSQFEKKYGTSGNRTKIVPLYRKPFFQLAVAASLGLIIFFTVPMFNSKQENTNADLAMKTTENNTGAGNTKETPVVDNIAMDMNKPDIGSGPVAENQQSPANISTEREQERPDGFMSGDELADLKAEEKLSSNAKFQTEYDRSNKAGEKLVSEDMSVVSKEKNMVDEISPAPPMLERSDKLNDLESAKKADALKGENPNRALKREKQKEENTYQYPNSDHTKDFAPNTNIYNTTTATGSVSNNALAKVKNPVSTFVEENKTQMMDMLFTVY